MHEKPLTRKPVGGIKHLKAKDGESQKGGLAESH